MALYECFDCDKIVGGQKEIVQVATGDLCHHKDACHPYNGLDGDLLEITIEDAILKLSKKIERLIQCQK